MPRTHKTLTQIELCSRQEQEQGEPEPEPVPEERQPVCAAAAACADGVAIKRAERPEDDPNARRCRRDADFGKM